MRWLLRTTCRPPLGELCGGNGLAAAYAVEYLNQHCAGHAVIRTELSRGQALEPAVLECGVDLVVEPLAQVDIGEVAAVLVGDNEGGEVGGLKVAFPVAAS